MRKATLFLICLLIELIVGSPITTPVPSTIAPEKSDIEKLENRTITDLLLEQTETVKKIVANQQHQHTKPIDYPIVTILKDSSKKEMTLEELKIKCQQLSKLLNTSRLHNDMKPLPTPASKPILFDQKKRPVYNHNTRHTTRKPGFYVTTVTTTTTTTTQKPPLTTPAPVPTNVKYIRLEPVILQKTILSDGRTVYYWHKSLPSAVAYPATSTTESTTQDDSMETTEAPTTSSYYNRWNFFTFYRSLPSTTEKPTTTTTTTTTTPKPDKLETIFQNQLRFVVPVPYQNPDGVPTKNVYDFDQYAYYPKDLQPSTINVQVPYTPSFHVIKALAVPNKYSKVPSYPESNLELVDV